MKLNTAHSNPVADVKIASSPEQLARGAKLANTCVGCHSTNGQFPLAGQNFAEGGPPVGTLYAANLTPGGELKDWTDGEIIRAIREGIHKNGRSLLIMPASAFHSMSDADVQFPACSFVKSLQRARRPWHRSALTKPGV